MKRKGGWRVGHASRESREGSREIAMQLGMLGKERRAEFSALTLIKDAVKEFEAEGTRTLLLEIMDSMGLTPGRPCNSCLAGGWCSRSAICTGLMKAHLA